MFYDIWSTQGKQGMVKKYFLCSPFNSKKNEKFIFQQGNISDFQNLIFKKPDQSIFSHCLS